MRPAPDARRLCRRQSAGRQVEGAWLELWSASLHQNTFTDETGSYAFEGGQGAVVLYISPRTETELATASTAMVLDHSQTYGWDGAITRLDTLALVAPIP